MGILTELDEKYIAGHLEWLTAGKIEKAVLETISTIYIGNYTNNRIFIFRYTTLME